MIDSNFYILTHYKLPPTEREKREAILAQTLAQLEAYQRRALKPAKVTLTNKLIEVYNQYLSKGEK